MKSPISIKAETKMTFPHQITRRSVVVKYNAFKVAEIVGWGDGVISRTVDYRFEEYVPEIPLTTYNNLQLMVLGLQAKLVGAGYKPTVVRLVTLLAPREMQNWQNLRGSTLVKQERTLDVSRY